jgi:hypothetical protein
VTKLQAVEIELVSHHDELLMFVAHQEVLRPVCSTELIVTGQRRSEAAV